MKDIGLGVLDPYTVVIVLITLVLAQVLFGYPIPLDTTNATSLFISLVIFTGYIYAARSLVRLPVLGTKAALYIEDQFQLLEALKPFGRWFQYLRSLFKNIFGFLGSMWLLPVYWLMLVMDFSGNSYKSLRSYGKLKPLLENARLRLVLNLLDRLSVILIAILAVLPGFRGYLNWIGIAGIIFMLLIFVLKGNFTALISDELEKKLGHIKTPLNVSVLGCVVNGSAAVQSDLYPALVTAEARSNPRREMSSSST